MQSVGELVLGNAFNRGYFFHAFRQGLSEEGYSAKAHGTQDGEGFHIPEL